MSFVGDFIGGKVGEWITGGNDDKSQKVLQPRILGFKAGGYSFGRKGDVVTLNRSREVNKGIRGIQNANIGSANSLTRLGTQIRPGYGRLTNSIVQGLRYQRQGALSDLRDQFARRRISGSSFAADAQSRLEAEFAQKEKEFRAQAFVDEMKMTQENIAQINQARVNAYSVLVNQLNFEAKMGADLAIAGQNTLAGLAEAQSHMYANEADRQEGYYAPLVNGIRSGVNGAIGGGMGGGGGSSGGGAWTNWGGMSGGGTGGFGP